MIALPEDPGVGGAVVLALGLLLAAAAAPLFWRRLRFLLDPAGPAGPPAAIVLAVAIVSAVGTAPFLSWRVVQDLRSTSQISRFNAERIGAYEGNLNAAAFDTAAVLIPPGDTYFVAAVGLGKGDFAAWARTFLLPRIAVESPSDAEWILTLGVDPRSVGVVVDGVRQIDAYGEGTFIARVVR